MKPLPISPSQSRNATKSQTPKTSKKPLAIQPKTVITASA